MRSLRAALWGSPSASPPSLPSRQLLSAAGPKASTLAARAAAEEAAQNTRPFVFVSTFKWEMRKGWDVLLERPACSVETTPPTPSTPPAPPVAWLSRTMPAGSAAALPSDDMSWCPSSVGPPTTVINA